MKPLEYKGYQAEVEWDEGEIFIRVLHVPDVLMTSCQDAGSVEEVFHALVDDYLETCGELGIEPSKPFKGSFNVRVSPELHRSAVLAATREEMTLNAWIGRAIESALGGEHAWSPRERAVLNYETPETYAHMISYVVVGGHEEPAAEARNAWTYRPGLRMGKASAGEMTPLPGFFAKRSEFQR